MSKLSFRARALDAAKPMPIYMTEELPDLPDYSAINRAVPQMPSGMEKEEECEHHLQRAICTGLIIPTPEVSNVEDTEAYDRLYTTIYKMPRQLIHMQPFAMEQDIPDYDMDSEDERFVNAQAKKMDLTPLKFEEMMDRLEKGSGQTVVTLQEAKGLLKEDDDLIIAVYDYWLNKRLKTVVPLIPVVKTEHRIGSAANNPYLAFRRRTEKMQTRKNRKNDETSYEKMLKLRRDLSRTVTLLELVKRREKTKRELLHLTIEVFEKRYQAQDFSGQLLAEISAIKTRPAFAPIFSNQFGLNQQHWLSKVPLKEEILVPRKEKRQYKRRKHKENIGSVINRGNYLMSSLQTSQEAMASSEEELEATRPEFSDLSQCDSDGMFSFRRKLGCSYLPPTSTGFGIWPWGGSNEAGGDKRFRYYPTSIATPRSRHIGLARKRMGRGGRVILDRSTNFTDEFWSSVDFTVYDNKSDLPLFQPKTPPEASDNHSNNSDGESAVESLPNTLLIDVENLEGCENLNSIHGSDDEQNGENAIDKYSTGGKRGSANEALVLANKSDEWGSEPEIDVSAAVVPSTGSDEKDRAGRTRGEETPRVAADDFGDPKGCASVRVPRGRGRGLRVDGATRVLGPRTFFHEKKDANGFSFNSISDLNRPGKHIFRRNYRIGGFKNVSQWRKKAKEGRQRAKREERLLFTTSEISLVELFADASVNLIPETGSETNDDSFAILDKLGLDDDFIKKEPEINLDVDAAVDKASGLLKPETGQQFSDDQSNPFQKQRLKMDKNIFEFSETDFLKYETDCDVDDLLPDLVQNDVVGCCGLFGLTPNSRFNLVSPTYLPLEGDHEAEEAADDLEEKLGPGRPDQKTESPTPSNYGQIADISSDIENHEVTLQLKMNGNLESGPAGNALTSRSNAKTDYSDDGYQCASGDQGKMRTSQDQTINYIFALNHHNYTISGPPGYGFKQGSAENSQADMHGTSSGGANAAASPDAAAAEGLAAATPALIATNSWKSNVSKPGPGILRTYRGSNNDRLVEITSDGSFFIQDDGKKTVPNGPATIGLIQKKINRGSTGHQQGPASAQNPVAGLSTCHNAASYATVSVTSGQSFPGANQSYVGASQPGSNYVGSNPTVKHGTPGDLNLQPQRKVSLLVNPTPVAAEPDGVGIGIDLGNDSLETVDIETSEGEATAQEMGVDAANQMNVRKNNSLPMEVT